MMMNYECDMPTDGLENHHVRVLMRRYLESRGCASEEELELVIKWANEVVTAWIVLQGLFEGSLTITGLSEAGEPIFATRTHVLMEADRAAEGLAAYA